MPDHNHTGKERNGQSASPGRQRDEERRRFVRQLASVDDYWVKVLGDSLFHDMNYYDLFTGMWLRLNSVPGSAFRKSELHQLMPHISQRTAVKYVQNSINHGLLIEEADPDDLRSKRITMSPDLQRRVELFLDYAIPVFQAPSSREKQREKGGWAGALHTLNALKVLLRSKWRNGG